MSKYGAIRTEVDGIMFASKAEARRYGELLLIEKAGEIQNLELQPKFVLQEAFECEQYGKSKKKKISAIRYIADFKYQEKGITVIEDVKGMMTPVFRLKMKMFLKQYPKLLLRLTK